MNFKEYAKKYGKTENNNFAIACYDQNSLEELENCTEPDEMDMKTWEIDQEEWRDAIKAALTEKKKE